MQIREIITESSDHYIIYVDKRPVVKYRDRRAADEMYKMYKSKYPHRRVEIKYEDCKIVDVS